LFFIGCSEGEKNYVIETENGIKVYKNSGKTSDKELVISPKEIFEIKGMENVEESSPREFVWPRFLDIDSKGNIYIVDRVSASVKKFDKEGRFLESFGRDGQGPGEMRFPYMIIILNDILFVYDPGGRRLVKFDTAGHFLGNLSIQKYGILFTKSVGKDKAIGFLRKYERAPNGGVYSIFNLTLMDDWFQPIRILREYKVKFDLSINDFLDRYTAYAVAEDKIFVAENSEDKYRINVFDHSGQLLYAIEKNYEKVTFTKDELDELNDTLGNIIKKFGQDYVPVKAVYKKSINSMYYDKEGRLLVASSVKRDPGNRYDFLVDVFKDGVFLKKVKLDIANGYDYVKVHDDKIFFKGSRIYYLNEAEALLKVFEY
jgi:hypothetical protein